MILTTKYNIGDKVFAAYEGYENIPLTIGQISKVYVDSPGMNEDTMFDNYKPQKKDEEIYMCIETGIGSGRTYLVTDLFLTPEKATKRLKEKEKN
jgi:hypothetical protein